MGQPQNARDAAAAAPAYDDVFSAHPVNGFPSSGQSSAYARVAQDDEEFSSHRHNHSSSPAAPHESGSRVPKVHSHCEQCDVQTAARERRANEKHCCTMVAATFMVALTCVTILAITVASLAYKKKYGQGHP